MIEYLPYINLITDWTLISVGIYVIWIVRINIIATRNTLARLDALPRPILKDLQKRAKKAEKHPVVYMVGGKVRTADDVVKGNIELDRNTV